jgi:hypothetical protein
MTSQPMQPYDWYDKLVSDTTVQLLQRFANDPALTYADPETRRLARKTLEQILDSVAPKDTHLNRMTRQLIAELLEVDSLLKQ